MLVKLKKQLDVAWDKMPALVKMMKSSFSDPMESRASYRIKMVLYYPKLIEAIVE